MPASDALLVEMQSRIGILERQMAQMPLWTATKEAPFNNVLVWCRGSDVLESPNGVDFLGISADGTVTELPTATPPEGPYTAGQFTEGLAVARMGVNGLLVWIAVKVDPGSGPEQDISQRIFTGVDGDVPGGAPAPSLISVRNIILPVAGGGSAPVHLILR